MSQALTLTLITFGTCLVSSFITDQKLSESIKRGKEVYAQNCQNCHMEDGKGTPEMNSPFARADYIKKSAKILSAKQQ